jgi:hypothetical protein
MGLFATIIIMTFSIIILTIKCHYPHCRYAECRNYLNVMLSIVVLNVVMLNVVAPQLAIVLRPSLLP